MFIKKYFNFIKESNTIDNLLDKIHNNGITSLSSDELNYLKNPTIENERKLSYKKFVFNDQNFGIKYEHYFTEHNGNSIIHYGNVIFNHYTFDGCILCDSAGEFENSEFILTQDIDDIHYSKGDNLYYIGEGLEHEIDRFFADDICPNLL